MISTTQRTCHHPPASQLARNAHIFLRFMQGQTLEMLRDEFSLSILCIKKLIKQMAKRLQREVRLRGHPLPVHDTALLAQLLAHAEHWQRYAKAYLAALPATLECSDER